MSLGKQLKNQLEMRKMTVKDFAKEIGVPPTTLYSFINRDSESGKSDLIFKICQGLDISLSDFINVEVNIDFNDPYNIAVKKLKNKEPLTDEEIELIQNTWNSESFKQQIAKLPEKIDELSKRLKANYDLLNEKGKEKALEQVELLTKIPEYRKDNK